MLTYFPVPYPDELLYGTASRYHFRLGNVDYRDTITEIFGSSGKLPSFFFPTNISYLASQLPASSNYSTENLINNHTLFPLYRLFLPSLRAKSIYEQMANGKGEGVYASIGMMAGGLCPHEMLVYCPKCVEEDVEILGESYFRRSHNVQGVFVCHKHGCLLKEYSSSYRENSRLRFIRLEHKRITCDVEFPSQNLKNHLMMVACSANYLLNNPVLGYNQSLIHEKYLSQLNYKGFLTVNGRVKQQELLYAFRSRYSDELLKRLDSDLDEFNEYSWIKVITRKPKRTVHPIRHILFIHFLYDSIEEFFQINRDEAQPFGSPPWFCLNTAANHYLEPVVYQCVITADSKSRQPVGAFSCNCGFVFSRKGPDKSSDDRFRIGRTKQFGHIWEHKLETLILNGSTSLRELARQMSCDPKTVVSYAAKLGLESYLNTTMKPYEPEPSHNNNEGSNRAITYAADIKNYMELNPDCRRTDIRNNLSKQYSWFYRNQPEWLEQNLPGKGKQIRRNSEPRVNWPNRDTQILFLLKAAHREINELPKPVRITRSRLAKLINHRALLERHIDKLPRSEKFLSEVTESVGDFQKRRVTKVTTDLYMDKNDIQAWEIVRKAGIRPEFVSDILPTIEDKLNALRFSNNNPYLH